MLDTLLLRYARMWPVGLSPRAPGTCGSLAAIILAPFIFLPADMFWRIGLLLFVLVSGAIAAGRAERLLGEEDPKSVVIDELLGQWLTLLPFYGLSFWELGAAFILFRIFDIFKPWPVNLAEKIPGGMGIMADDAVAGLYAMACLAVMQWIF